MFILYDFIHVYIRIIHVFIMEVGRVLMSSVFLLCLVRSFLFPVEDVGPQHRVSYSQYPWTFWEEFNLDFATGSEVCWRPFCSFTSQEIY